MPVATLSREIVRVEETHLGYESHGILTAYLRVTNGSTVQNIGGYSLSADNGASCARFIAWTLKACGVESWEKVQGRTIYVLTDETRKVVGIEPLPTEPGQRFIFADAFPIEGVS